MTKAVSLPMLFDANLILVGHTRQFLSRPWYLGSVVNSPSALFLSVLLFDEMEKAHPDVFNVMLQLLDDGRLTDSKGNSVNFRNTIVIFTSNIGSQDILDLDASQRDLMKERVTNAMKEHFRPEFLNRIDEYVIFNSLDKEALREIVKLEIRRLDKRLAEKEIVLTITENALDLLANVGFDPVYGARPLKRTIQRELETTVARGILNGDYGDGDNITVDAVGDRLEVFKTFDGGYSNTSPGVEEFDKGYSFSSDAFN
jgi:ATP-dependent Clp protease ATP-binding subunit ClpB